MRTPLLFIVTLLVGCTATPEVTLKAELAAANHCEVKEDCELIGSKCPFDCYIYVNKNEANRLKPLVENFESQCTYSCIASQGVECEQNKCVVIPDVGHYEDGNTGASCTSHEECITPMDYLVRSVCQYGSMCIENSCSVTCPIAEAGRCSKDADCDCKGYGAGNAKGCKCINDTCFAVVE